MKKTLVNAALLFSGIMLFMLPQPNFIRAEGFPLFAYIAFVPVFILTRRLSWKSVWLYGLLYGIGCYVTFTSWLATFPIRGGAVPQEWSDSGTPKSLFFAMCRKKSP